MPYQKFIDDNEAQYNISPEEYLRLLAIQCSNVNHSGYEVEVPRDVMPPGQQQHQDNSRQYHNMGINVEDHVHDGNRLPMNSFNDDFSSSGRRVSHPSSNISRTFIACSDQFNRNTLTSVNHDNAIRNSPNARSQGRSSFRHSWHPTRNTAVDFSREISSSFSARGRFAPQSRNQDVNDRGMFFASNSSLEVGSHRDLTYSLGFYGHSSPPASLPHVNRNTLSNMIQPRCEVTDSSNFVEHRENEAHSSSAQGKRRRIHSDELMLDMLSHFIPPPEAIHAVRSINELTNPSYRSNSVNLLRDDSPPMSPLSRRRGSSVRGHAQRDASMGQIPDMFADYLLGVMNNEDNKDLKRFFPPPPLYTNNDSKSCHAGVGMCGTQNSGKNLDINGNESCRLHSSLKSIKSNDKDFNCSLPEALNQEQFLLEKLKTPYSSETLCFPPRRKNDSSPIEQKKYPVSENMLKNTTFGDSSSPRSLAATVTTPKSATVATLSNGFQKQNHDSPQDSLASYPDSYAREIALKKTEDNEGLSVPPFALSMEASQISQQSIHDWDRKFGLRRAHSKTMRDSARSRKNVLNFLKGEGSYLLKSAKATGMRDSGVTVTTLGSSIFASMTSTSSQDALFLFDEEADNGENWERPFDSTKEKSSVSCSTHNEPDGGVIVNADIMSRDESLKGNNTNKDPVPKAFPTSFANDDNSIGSFSDFDHSNEDSDTNDPISLSYSSNFFDPDQDDEEELVSMFHTSLMDIGSQGGVQHKQTAARTP